MQAMAVEPGPAKAQQRRYLLYKTGALLLTAVSYAAFHAARKVLPVVKSVLTGPSSDGPVAPTLNGTIAGGWAPFDGEEGKALLGGLDLAFLGTYSICLFFSGHLGDRLNLKWFLTAGMVGSGLFCALTGMAYFMEIHSYSFFVITAVCAGAFQSTGWPSVVSIVANWSGKGQRGLVMGLWAMNMPLGNIMGTVIAAALLAEGWGWSFVALGLLMLVLAVVVAVFLVVQPMDVGLAGQQQSYSHVHVDDSMDTVPEVSAVCITGASKANAAKLGHERAPARFIDALFIPGVMVYSGVLFFTKLVLYTCMLWLPFYISSAPIGGQNLTAQEAGQLSVLWDIGGVVGGIVAGHLSDHSGASALVTAGMLTLSIPSLWLYRKFGSASLWLNMLLMTVAGALTSGPAGLIATAVSADLGNHETLQGNAQLQATVIAIIDGIGSLGAALGPLLTGILLKLGSFDMVFAMLEVSAIIAVLMLASLATQDVRRLGWF